MNAQSGPTAIAALGRGWVADEALSIGLFCALTAQSFTHGVIQAVNHDGDSDSTGSIAGNLLGAMLGEQAIDPHWLDRLELRQVIMEIADDLYVYQGWHVSEYDRNEETDRITSRYPGF